MTCVHGVINCDPRAPLCGRHPAARGCSASGLCGGRPALPGPRCRARRARCDGGVPSRSSAALTTASLGIAAGDRSRPESGSGVVARLPPSGQTHRLCRHCHSSLPLRLPASPTESAPLSPGRLPQGDAGHAAPRTWPTAHCPRNSSLPGSLPGPLFPIAMSPGPTSCSTQTQC